MVIADDAKPVSVSKFGAIIKGAANVGLQTDPYRFMHSLQTTFPFTPCGAHLDYFTCFGQKAGCFHENGLYGETTRGQNLSYSLYTRTRNSIFQRQLKTNH